MGALSTKLEAIVSPGETQRIRPAAADDALACADPLPALIAGSVTERWAETFRGGPWALSLADGV